MKAFSGIVNLLILLLSLLLSNSVAAQTPDCSGRLTRAVLQGQAGLGLAASCDQIYERLKDERILDLSGQQIDELGFFSSLSQLRELRVQGTGIRNLSPLTQLPNLEVLWIYGRDLSDLRPLQEMRNLREIWIVSQSVRDLPDLSMLPRLRLVWLDAPEFTNVARLSSLSNLEKLWLFSRKNLDISPLFAIPRLTDLSVHSPRITGMSVLRNLPNLRSLWIMGKDVDGFDQLAETRNLESLYLFSDQVREVPEVNASSNVKLKNLVLKSTNLDSVYGLNKQVDLVNLAMINTSVTDLRGLEQLHRLQTFSLSNSSKVDFSSLPRLRRLKSLDISNTGITDLGIIQTSFPDLEKLNASNNRLTDIEVIADFRFLRNLDLSSNNIRFFTDYGTRTCGLAFLNVNNNPIQNHGGFNSCRFLRHLELAGTGMSDLTGIQELKNLTLLNIANNKVRIQDLKLVSPLNQLESLDIRGNGLRDASEIMRNLVGSGGTPHFSPWLFDIKWDGNLSVPRDSQRAQIRAHVEKLINELKQATNNYENSWKVGIESSRPYNDVTSSLFGRYRSIIEALVNYVNTNLETHDLSPYFGDAEEYVLAKFFLYDPSHEKFVDNHNINLYYSYYPMRTSGDGNLEDEFDLIIEQLKYSNSRFAEDVGVFAILHRNISDMGDIDSFIRSIQERDRMLFDLKLNEARLAESKLRKIRKLLENNAAELLENLRRDLLLEMAMSEKNAQNVVRNF